LLIGRAAASLWRGARLQTSLTWIHRVFWAGLGILLAAQVVSLLLMAQFVATHETPNGFGQPLRDYLTIVGQALVTARENNAAEVLVMGQGDSIVVDEVPAIFDVLLRGRTTYRFVDGQSTALFPPHPALVLLTPQAGNAAAWYQPWPAHDLRGGYRLALLDGSWPQASLEPVSNPRVFQNGVELQGFRWETDAQDKPEGTFWLLWQILWQSRDDTHFFVHLVDGNGQKWAQQDSAGYPLAYRRKGDRLISRFDIISLAGVQPGQYWARVGQYTYPDVKNISVIDEVGNPTTDAVTVGPLVGGGP
jgi:hypothetical protein